MNREHYRQMWQQYRLYKNEKAPDWSGEYKQVWQSFQPPEGKFRTQFYECLLHTKDIKEMEFTNLFRAVKMAKETIHIYEKLFGLVVMRDRQKQYEWGVFANGHFIAAVSVWEWTEKEGSIVKGWFRV